MARNPQSDQDPLFRPREAFTHFRAYYGPLGTDVTESEDGPVPLPPPETRLVPPTPARRLASRRPDAGGASGRDREER